LATSQIKGADFYIPESTQMSEGRRRLIVKKLLHECFFGAT